MNRSVRSLLCVGMVGASAMAMLPTLTVLTAQTRATAKRWSPPLTSDGQPDLQGVWTDTSITPLERPKALAGRDRLTDEEVRKMERRFAEVREDPRVDFLAGDNLFIFLFEGLETYRTPNATHGAEIMVEREFDNRTSLITDPPDGRLPSVTPQGARRQAAFQAATQAVPSQGLDKTPEERQAAAAALRPTPAGPGDLSNGLRCITWGVPILAGNINYTSHYQIVQSPGTVVLLSEVNHEARVIPTDGGPHIPQRLRQWNGDSRGRWEGHTLVIDTTNFSLASYFMGSSEGLHLTERITRTGADTMNYAIIVDDPSTWVRSWTAVVRLRRSEERLYEFACHEGNHHVIRSMLGAARAEDTARAKAGASSRP